MFRFSLNRTVLGNALPLLSLFIVFCITSLTPLNTFAFYAAANEAVVIDEPITDDAYIAGDTVRIIAPISHDAYLAGGDVTVLSPVDDDLHITGGTVYIDAPISGDLFIFGGTVKLSRNSSVGGSLVVAAGTVSLDSPVAGDAYVFSDQFHAVSGSVGGDVYYNADIAESIDTLTVSGDRHLAFHSLRPDLSQEELFSFLAISSVLYFVSRYFTLLILTILTMFLLRRLLADSAKYLHNRYWHNFLIGVPLLFFGWIAALIALPFSLSLSLWLFVSWLVFAVFLSKVFVTSYITLVVIQKFEITHKLTELGVIALTSLLVIIVYLITPVNFGVTVFLFAPLFGSLTTIKMFIVRDYLSGHYKLKLK